MIFIFFLLILNLIILINLKKISKMLNIYDHPDGKLKIHKEKVPLIGGLILIINFSIIFFYQIFFQGSFLSLNIDYANNFELFSLLILIYSYFFLGLYDDKFYLSPFKKLLISILIIFTATFYNENLIISNIINFPFFMYDCYWSALWSGPNFVPRRDLFEYHHTS